MATIYLAGGCFWGVEKFFEQFYGLETEAGYANGLTENPSYEDLHATGHAEAVKIDYDPETIGLEQILEYYFMIIDPFSVNRQGNDFGKQYRTGIWYTSDDQADAIDNVVSRVEEAAGKPVAVQIGPIRNYYTAEEYHQRYLDKHPQGYCHIDPALFNLDK